MWKKTKGLPLITICFNFLTHTFLDFFWIRISKKKILEFCRGKTNSLFYKNNQGCFSDDIHYFSSENFTTNWNSYLSNKSIDKLLMNHDNLSGPQVFFFYFSFISLFVHVRSERFGKGKRKKKRTIWKRHFTLTVLLGTSLGYRRSVKILGRGG